MVGEKSALDRIKEQGINATQKEKVKRDDVWARWERKQLSKRLASLTGLAICCLGWFVFTISVGLPMHLIVVFSLVGGVLTFALTLMTYVIARDIARGELNGGNSSDWSIPAPSKQTQRMLKRNIRRRWF